ncbi:MAG: pitrilysin family protein [Bryobacteraceae bacterium]
MRTTSALAALAAGTTILAAAELKIPFEKYKLENGLRVILSKDNSAPVVAVYVIYDVGARSEQKGRTGFAHLFEHMMFQGSKNAPKGMHFETVESNGGNLNGSTHPDFTDYFEVLPSNKLPVALWLEADRMRGLNITDENLTNQKEAVKQERRLSFDNRAYATAIVDEFPKVFFDNFQSNHSLIGSFEDLNAATVDDVAAFFKTYYAPNNAVLVIVGDIQTADTKKWVEAYFADIPSQPRPPKPDLSEPAKKEAKWAEYKDPLAKLPAVVLAYPGPKRRSPDFYAMAMLDVLLTAGNSSRLNLALVKGKESVVGYEANLGWPFASTADYVDPEPYAMAFFYKPNFTAKQIVEQAEAEIDKIKNEGVPADELARIRTFLRSDRIRGVRTVLRRAQLLGQYDVFDGDPNMINTELDQYLAVTSERIQAAAKKYCDSSKRSVLAIVPAPKKSEKESGQ